MSEYSDYEDSEIEEEYEEQEEDCRSEEDEEQEVEYCSSAPERSSAPKVITKESLIAAQSNELSKVTDMLGIKRQHARTLLIHHRWDVESLCSKFAEKGIKRLFAEAGLAPVELISAPGFSNLCSLGPRSSVTCGTCFEEVCAEKASMMGCGHTFCDECWTGHFLVQIGAGQSRRIKCMAHRCDAICDEEVVTRLVSRTNPQAAEKYERTLLESYIEDNHGRVKWCPSVPHCGNAIRVEDGVDECCEVECTCGTQFCFKCGGDAHSPCSCRMWELWRRKCRDGSETANWITAHTKPCPKCSKLVHKDVGCNLISCVCGQYFCWLCGSATGREHTYSTIIGHTCGRYQDEEASREAMNDLNRYLHYYNRFEAHLASLKLEAETRIKIASKVASLEASHIIILVKDFSWLDNSSQRLFRARKALAYSYVFAYFMFGNDMFKSEISPQQNDINQYLFENQQQQLEAKVEQLSMAVGDALTLDPDCVALPRLQIMDLTKVADDHCRNLYDCIENQLLGNLQLHVQYIARYSSSGCEKAIGITRDLQQTS